MDPTYERGVELLQGTDSMDVVVDFNDNACTYLEILEAGQEDLAHLL